MPLLIALATLLLDAPLQQKGPDNQLVAELARCLDIADDRSRLGCTDKAARALVDAERRAEVVVVDREQVRRTRRSLFGLALPELSLFGNSRDSVRRPREAALERLETSVRAARAGQYDRWLLDLVEGGRWQTLEPWTVGPTPAAGTAVVIRRGPLGNYVLKASGARAVRAQRVN